VEPVADKVIQRINEASSLYYRLIMLVAPFDAGKTAVLQEVHERTSAPLININLELSRIMLDLTERERALHLPFILSEVVDKSVSYLVLLDNIEILFDGSLMLDPLRLLQGLSRNKTVVVALSGSIEGNYLVYATPDHPEYKRYPLHDFLLVNQEALA
jgi:predicted ATPase